MNFLEWEAYFKGNQLHFDHIDWNPAPQLSIEEKALIHASIQQFQRGEHSEGKHFMNFARTMEDESYLQTVKIFIKEEQDHALVLGRFMDIESIPRIKKDGLDNIFRRLRKLAGLEGTVTVLLTAEIISMVYYKALKAATSSHLLKQICEQILLDEEFHLRFQCYTLNLLQRRKSPFLQVMAGLLHRILMTGTIVMVWLFHSKVLSAGGYGFASFFNSVYFEFRRCRQWIQSKSKRLPAELINHAA